MMSEATISSPIGGVRPAPGHVHVWRQGNAVLDRDMLSEEETTRAARMATPALRARAIARRCFLRGMLGRYLAMAPHDVPLVIGPEGKPMLSEVLGLEFSISHSGDRSLLAVSRQVVGLDLEVVRPLPDWAELTRRVCSAREQKEITQSADPERAFMARWVIKEAVAKCRGTGLRDDLTQIDPGPLPFKDSAGVTIVEVAAKLDEIARLAVVGDLSTVSSLENEVSDHLRSVFGE